MMHFVATLVHLLEVRRKYVGQAVAVVLPSAVWRSRYGCPIPEESRSSASKMPAAELATVARLMQLNSDLTTLECIIVANHTWVLSAFDVV